MADLERVYDAIHREEEAHADLVTYLRNAHVRRVERDDEHEQRLRDAIVAAAKAVDAAIEERRREVVAAREEDDLYEPTPEAMETSQQ